MIPFSFWKEHDVQLPGLTLWLDAVNYDPSTGAWRDRSGNGLDAVQSIAASRPALVMSAMNGLPVVRLDGTDDGFDLPNQLKFSNPVTIIAVYKIKGNSSDTTYGVGTIYNTGTFGGDGPVGYGIAYQHLNTYMVAQIRGSSASVVSVGIEETTYALDTTYLHAGMISDTDISFYLNGTHIETLPHVYGNVTPTAFKASIGYRYSTTDNSRVRFFNGDIAEVIVYDRVLLSSERYIVEEYLNGKYAIY